MERPLRALYNAHYSEGLYQRYVERLERMLDVKIPFRIAETPLFLPLSLRTKLARHAREIAAQISAKATIDKMRTAIPARYDVPGMDDLASCLQVDFAIVRDPETGELDGRVVELQGFPSLYALMVKQTEALTEELRQIPGMPQDWSLYYSGHTRETFVTAFQKALLAGVPAEEVVMLDLDPAAQKTYADFVATHQLTGVESACPTDLKRDGRRLIRKRNGRLEQVRRIYNRIVFDELEVKGVELPFRWTDDLDVSWFPHPNWYWVWSKYTLPHVDHVAVPRATYLSELDAAPRDLSRYVLKPLFSFAGSGVKVDPTEADLVAVPREQRSGWILQEKIAYEPALPMPSGEGVKGEVRMMFLRGLGEPPTLVLNLVRLSRGKMLGVDQNKGMDWVGGSVGIWPADEGSP
ncbi:MAG: hypothetical protein JNL79_18060 [Myxococcales bacterium]|nr:hypothetical protein [Myxococcales bacterium]